MASRRRASVPSCDYTFDGKVCGQKGDHWCEPRAQRVRAFFPEVLCHTKGRFARKPFELAEWQFDGIIGPLFATVVWNEDLERYVRQYRIVWIELARKNGKSELLAGIVWYLLIADDEESAEIYGAAKDSKQARKVWDVVYRMLQLSPVLNQWWRDGDIRVNLQEKRVIYEPTGSYYELVTADAAGELGHNPHGIVFDEVLAQPNNKLWEALRRGMGTRDQPMMVAATTAGNDSASFAAKQHVEMEKIVEDPARAPHVLVFMRNLPMDADPWDEENWYWPNPALSRPGKHDGFLTIQALRDEVLEAQNDPSAENGLRQFRFNQWVQQATRWMPLHLYDQCGGIIDEAQLVGNVAYGGLDMSATTDMTALSWFFPGSPHRVIRRFWIPESRVAFLDKHTGGRFSVWVREGFVTAIPGDVIDDKVVRTTIESDATTFDVKNIGIDKWNALSISNSLEEIGIETTLIRQGFALSAGLKEMMRLVKSRDASQKTKDFPDGMPVFNHGGNPVARWMADAVEVKRDSEENLKPVKPDRDASGKRIDGVVTDAMAIMCWMLDTQEEAVDNTLVLH